MNLKVIELGTFRLLKSVIKRLHSASKSDCLKSPMYNSLNIIHPI